MAELPSGTVTFLFTDLEGSTRLWEEHPDAMRDALARHDVLVRTAIEARGGHVVKTTGDGFHAVFRTAHEAMDAAVDAQRLLADEPWGEPGPLRVRMGIHTGETQERDGDFYGTAVNRAARLMAVAHGGQVVCSRATVEVGGATVEVRSLGEHRLRDLGAAQEIFQVGDGSYPPLQSVDVVPTNLPTVLTELIGRSEEVARITGLLERERLVTLTGVGGVGKTRLALAVAAASVASFADGVWFVELAPVSSSDDVVRAAAAAMGAPVADRTSLAQYVSERQVLVVLDNCEHVLNDAAALAEAMVGSGPEVVIVATSREPLGLDGETVRGVRSLAVPDPDADDAEVAGASAVRLFVERASAATDTFSLSDANVAAVVDICGQLDGIPLAIELAAARVRAMPPAEIARRLDERFRLLSAGRGSHERHRTLQATVSWSHDLLGDAERRVFRRLAVFPGSFDLDAAEAVAGDADTDVIDGLIRLVEQSLVQYDATTGRYRLLETLRQYAADRLADAGEATLIQDRHADFYVGFASEHASGGGYPTTLALRRCETDMDNLHTAADWLAAHERWGELLRLARGLFGFGYHADAIAVCRWYDAALDHDPVLDAQGRADALGELTVLRRLAGEPEDDQAARSSIELADAAGLPHSPWAWSARYFSLSASGRDRPGAQVAAASMLAVAQTRDDEFATINALGFCASTAAAVGDLSESVEYATEVLRRARATQNPNAIATALIMASTSLLAHRAEPDFAAGLTFLEANPVDPESAGRSAGIWLNRMWGLARLGVGQAEAAVPHLTQSLRLADQRFPVVLTEAALALSVALGEAGQPLRAVELDGYAGAHFVASSSTEHSETWLRPRLAAIEATLGEAELAAARETGARLDRRGFMRLLAEAEQSVAPSTAE